jgi:hypothetical protein
LLGASFRPSLTTTPLRSATVHRYPVLCGLSPPVIKHAWHTKKKATTFAMAFNIFVQ